MLTVGVIGCGYWGPNLVRNLVENRRCQNVLVCDLDRARLVEPAERALVAALDAVAPTFTTYSASRFSRSAGEKMSWLPLTRTSPGAFGSMLKAALVLAGSIG